MRRFYGYLAMVVTLIVVVFSNLQTQIQKVTSNIEYSGGYEVLYKVDLKDSTKDVKAISDIVVSRLEDAGVQNSTVVTENGTKKGSDEDYVRVKMSGESETNIDYVLRSVEATGKLTVSTLMDDANYPELENPFVIGSAEVNWNSSTPYVSVEIKDCKEFINFVDNCKKDYEAFNEQYGDGNDDSSSSVDGVMVIWLDKEETDSYIQAYKNESEVTKSQIRQRVLAIVPTNNFNYETDVNGEYKNAKLLISYYTFDQTQMVAESAHTVERIINYGAQDYAMTRLYSQRINATVTKISGYDQIVMWGLIASLALILIYMVVRFGLAGLAGWTSVLVSMFAQFAFFNYFEYVLSTISVIGFIASLVINVAAVILYLSKFKNEMYKGKTPSKANQEASKNTLVNILDLFFLGLLVGIVGIFTLSSQIKLFPTVVIIGAVGSLVITRLGTMLMMHWLVNNKLAINKPSIFMVNKMDIPDIMKTEPQRKFAPLSNVSVKEKGKKSSIVAAAVSGVCALLIAVFAIIPGVNVFNDTEDSKTYTRIEIASEVVKSNYLFQNKEKGYEFFAQKYPNLVVKNIDINVVENVAVDSTSNKENLADVAYISVELGGVIEDYTILDQITADLKEQDYVDPSTITVNLADCSATSVKYTFQTALIAVIVVGALSIGFILIRFGYNYAIASLVTLIPTALTALGFFSASRIPMSALSLTGIAAGLLIVVVAQLPLYERIKRLKHESKVKIVSYEQKEAITVQAFKDVAFASLMISAAALVAIVVEACFSPISGSILSTYGTMAISVIVGAASTFFLLLPVYLFLEKHFKIKFTQSQEKREKKNKKAMEKAKQAHKNAGAEPEESKIPGINC